MSRIVLIIGGGVTGMQTALVLSELGIASLLIEKSGRLGGRVTRLSRTFPFFNEDGFNNGGEFTAELIDRVAKSARIETRLSCTLESFEGTFPDFFVRLSDGSERRVGCVVVSAGFEPFDPSTLPEYGYDRYPNVITAMELEWMLNTNGPSGGKVLRPSDGEPVKKLAIIFCVGSRNRRIGAPFCSRICCSFSTKQALTVIDRHPDAEVTCFYMDVRTYDRGFEEMYSLAQERGVKYLRGRVSGCKELPDGNLSLKAEHTLLQKMYNGVFDLVSLSTGMRPCAEVAKIAEVLGIRRSDDGFLASKAWFRYPHDATRNGVLIAGCATGMKPIRNCMIDASATAARAASMLRAALA